MKKAQKIELKETTDNPKQWIFIINLYTAGTLWGGLFQTFFAYKTNSLQEYQWAIMLALCALLQLSYIAYKRTSNIYPAVLSLILTAVYIAYRGLWLLPSSDLASNDMATITIVILSIAIGVLPIVVAIQQIYRNEICKT
jgi:hypothetical protein